MLIENTIKAPKVFFGELGGLHDAFITAFSWNKENQTFSISIDDLNSNFLDLPEYKGLCPVDIVFVGVCNLDCNIQIKSSNFSIYDFLIEEETCYSVNIKCSPGGYFKCQCETIKLIEKNKSEKIKGS
ncbi:hypothetical protein NBRC116493_36010 [Aurantivibrio infirmus]